MRKKVNCSDILYCLVTAESKLYDIVYIESITRKVLQVRHKRNEVFVQVPSLHLEHRYGVRWDVKHDLHLILSLLHNFQFSLFSRRSALSLLIICFKRLLLMLLMLLKAPNVNWYQNFFNYLSIKLSTWWWTRAEHWLGKKHWLGWIGCFGTTF